MRPLIAACSSNLRSQHRLESMGGREGKLLLWENESRSVSCLLWNIIVRRLWVIECYFTDHPSRQRLGYRGFIRRVLRKYFLLQEITLEKSTFLTRKFLYESGVLKIKTTGKTQLHRSPELDLWRPLNMCITGNMKSDIMAFSRNSKW